MTKSKSRKALIRQQKQLQLKANCRKDKSHIAKQHYKKQHCIKQKVQGLGGGISKIERIKQGKTWSPIYSEKRWKSWSTQTRILYNLGVIEKHEI